MLADVPPPAVADMTALTFAPTAEVVTLKEPEEAPAPIERLAGTKAAAALLDNNTFAPPSGATALRVTVQVVILPPVTAVGPQLIPDTGGPDATAMVPVEPATF